MSKNQRNRPPTLKPASPVAAATAHQFLPQTQVVTTTEVQQYQGQIPHPDVLRGFDELMPGTAVRLVQWAEDEQKHRQALEVQAQAANIEAQKRQLDIAEYQSHSVFRSDLVGQICGVVVCLACIGGAVALALAGHTGVALALTAIPTGAVIYSFRGNLFAAKTKGQSPGGN